MYLKLGLLRLSFGQSFRPHALIRMVLQWGFHGFAVGRVFHFICVLIIIDGEQYIHKCIYINFSIYIYNFFMYKYVSEKLVHLFSYQKKI